MSLALSIFFFSRSSSRFLRSSSFSSLWGLEVRRRFSSRSSRIGEGSRTLCFILSRECSRGLSLSLSRSLSLSLSLRSLSASEKNVMRWFRSASIWALMSLACSSRFFMANSLLSLLERNFG